MPCAFGSILLSFIFLSLSLLDFFLLLPITSVMASFAFTSFPHLPVPPRALATFCHAPSPSLLIFSLFFSAFHLPPHLFIYFSFGSPPSSSYFSVRRVSPSRHQWRENGWGTFGLFLLPSVYLLFSMFQVSLKLTSNTLPKSFVGLPKGLQPCRHLIFDWNSW